MSEPRQHSDDELIELLRAGLTESDPVPTDVTTFAKVAFGWREIDADLAEVSFDSNLEASAAVRSTSTVRILTFESEEWSIDVEYDSVARTLLGHVNPERHISVELHTSDGSNMTESDSSGRFGFEDVSPGPVSLVARTSDGTVVAKTEWTLL